MIALNVQQGTIEWIVQRLWRLTASRLKPNITATGKLSESMAAFDAIDKLIAGIDLANEINRRRAEVDAMDDYQLKRFMSHYNGDSFSGSIHTERGKDHEADAVAKLSAIVGSQIGDVGMVVMGNDPNGLVSCSPDGFEYAGGKPIAGAEVKNPCLCGYYGHVAEKVLPDDYALQVHAGMAICELEVWHFASHFKGKPLFYQRVTRSKFTDTLAESLKQFEVQYRERYELVTGEVLKLAEAAPKLEQGKEAA